MTNTLAIALGLVIVALLAADQVWADGANALFLARKGVDLLRWIAFWR